MESPILVLFADESKGDEAGAFLREDGMLVVFIDPSKTDVSDAKSVYNTLMFEMNHYNPSNPYVYDQKEKEVTKDTLSHRQEEGFTSIGRKDITGEGNAFYDEIKGSKVLDIGNGIYGSIDPEDLDYRDYSINGFINWGTKKAKNTAIGINNLCNKNGVCKEVKKDAKKVVNVSTKVVVNSTDKVLDAVTDGRVRVNKDVVEQVNKPEGTIKGLKKIVEDTDGSSTKKAKEAIVTIIVVDKETSELSKNEVKKLNPEEITYYNDSWTKPKEKEQKTEEQLRYEITYGGSSNISDHLNRMNNLNELYNVSPDFKTKVDALLPYTRSLSEAQAAAFSGVGKETFEERQPYLDTISFGANFIPVYGQIRGIEELITGRDYVTGRERELLDKVLFVNNTARGLVQLDNFLSGINPSKQVEREVEIAGFGKVKVKVDSDDLDELDNKTLNTSKNNNSNSSVNNNVIKISNKSEEFLNEALKQQKLTNIPKGLKQNWIEDGFKYEVRIHAGDATYTNAASIYRVARQKIPQPGTQGSGWEYMDKNGNWFQESVLKPYYRDGSLNPIYNDAAAKNTHIPVPSK